jgi:hypothetical protein
MAVCSEQAPTLATLTSGRTVACHLHAGATIPIHETALVP